MTKNTGAYIQIILLCIAILLGAVLVYQPHFDYPYPLLGDEYVHIALGKYVLEEQALPFTNPYFAVPFPHVNFESGFDLLLAGLFLLMPGDPVLQYKFFAVAFFILNGLLLYYLVSLWFKNHWTALFAVFFFGTIKSGSGLLAHQHFIPLTFGTTLLLLSFILFHKWTENHEWKWLLFLGGTLVALAFSYPPALFFFLGVILVYELSMNHSLHKFLHTTKKKLLWCFFGSVVISMVLFIAIFSYFNVLGKIVFFSGWNGIEIYFSPIFFFGIVPSTLAALGLYIVVTSRRETSKIILSWFLFSFGSLSVFYLLDFSVFIPAQRLFIFYLVGVSILAGVGVSSVVRLGCRVFSSRHGTLILVTCVLAIIPSFHYYTVFAKPIEFHKILTPEIYESLTFLAKNYPGSGIVVADSVTSIAVYPVTGMRVTNLLNTNIGGGGVETTRTFLAGGQCNAIIGSLADLKYYTGEIDLESMPLFLLSQNHQNCPSILDPIYENGVSIYAVYISTEHNPRARRILEKNTLEGDGWIEYYDDRGVVRGKIKSTGQTYVGTWSLSPKSEVCSVYPDLTPGSCKIISIRGDTVFFFDVGGIPMPQRAAARIPGNPYDL